MRIIILEAGRVSESVAESLVSEKNDITTIDPDRLCEMDETHLTACKVAHDVFGIATTNAHVRSPE